MKAILLMFDSLKRDWLPPYGGDIAAPNFERLARHTVTLDRFYVGSMPCMPARRELHTGRYGFFHEGWSPLEPFDDSVPELLKARGVHTHLASDHHHYWRDGGANYHTRYSTYEHIRGQEGDPWKADPRVAFVNTSMADSLPPFFEGMMRQDTVNRHYMPTEAEHCQTQCFDAGMAFLDAHKDTDQWFLQLECFDPHEPFYTYEQYRALYPSAYEGRHIDWPMPGTADQDADYVAYIQNQYKALVSMIDKNLGRVLDYLDEGDRWSDTLLIVNTDHGLLLGEHEWWSKGAMPLYNEVANIPCFVWDPRAGKMDERRESLAQNIDVAATLLDFFGAPLPGDMEGRPMLPIVQDDSPIHDTALFGYFGGQACVTDGRYVYMRGPAAPQNMPLNEYTLIPARMASRADVRQLQKLALAEPFRFTKGCKTIKLDMAGHDTPFSNPYRFGSRLYDLAADPGQKRPIDDPATELRLINRLMERMAENDAPPEQYERLGLFPGMTEADLLAQRAAFAVAFAPPEIPGLDWTAEALSQWQTLHAFARGADFTGPFAQFAKARGLARVTPEAVNAFAAAALPKEQAGMALMMLKLAARLD